MSSPISDHDLIRNCIARYCVGVDLEDWALFSTAVHENVQINMPPPASPAHGLAALVSAAKAVAAQFSTQHVLSTQVIELTGEKTASATTYFTATIFGKGKHDGKHATHRGLYKDKLVKISIDGREDWRLAEREGVFQWPLTGDLSLFAP